MSRQAPSLQPLPPPVAHCWNFKLMPKSHHMAVLLMHVPLRGMSSQLLAFGLVLGVRVSVEPASLFGLLLVGVGSSESVSEVQAAAENTKVIRMTKNRDNAVMGRTKKHNDYRMVGAIRGRRRTR